MNKEKISGIWQKVQDIFAEADITQKQGIALLVTIIADQIMAAPNGNWSLVREYINFTIDGLERMHGTAYDTNDSGDEHVPA